MKLTLTLLGRDSWSRPVYEGSDGRLYVDTTPLRRPATAYLHEISKRLQWRAGYARQRGVRLRTQPRHLVRKELKPWANT